MQRMYSIFPDSWPGIALLIMRFGQCVQFFSEGSLQVMHGTTLPAALLYGLELLTSGLLAIGLWVPVAGVLQALLECPGIYSHGDFDRGHFDGALLAFCLSLLGPGAWSIDARLFGRRRIRLDRLRDPDDKFTE